MNPHETARKQSLISCLFALFRGSFFPYPQAKLTSGFDDEEVTGRQAQLAELRLARRAYTELWVGYFGHAEFVHQLLYESHYAVIVAAVLRF